jgi:transcription elongation factor
MAAVAAIAGVGMMVCCSSSVAALMMGGGEEKEDPIVPKTPVVPTLPSGQYVKLVHTVAQDNSAAGNADDKNKILNLAELEVFAKGGTTSLAAGKTVTGTSLAAGYPGTNLVDGNMTNLAHTFGRAADVLDEFLVDLGSVQEIEKIKITNRTDCCQKRAIGVKAVILGADGTTVIKETAAITTEAATYTFTFPGTAWA